ncbi:hypothetical protein DdX_08740 [Ditylenchus destructor]|uniref:Uncharacterized protein n=1 Tax=Ditylenchus destructor TaxID=166010 RepID=A0AAD4R709_9BILA|nr:hypothetical protein DdX_08740 [Ditylenchus destructor]
MSILKSVRSVLMSQPDRLSPNSSMSGERKRSRAWLWLLAIVLIQTFFMAGWVMREYFYVRSYQCVSLFNDWTGTAGQESVQKAPRFLMLDRGDSEPGEVLPFPDMENDKEDEIFAETESLRLKRSVTMDTSSVVIRKEYIDTGLPPPSGKKKGRWPTNAKVESTVEVVPLKTMLNMEEGDGEPTEKNGLLRTKTTQNRVADPTAVNTKPLYRKRKLRLRKRKKTATTANLPVLSTTASSYVENVIKDQEKRQEMIRESFMLGTAIQQTADSYQKSPSKITTTTEKPKDSASQSSPTFEYSEGQATAPSGRTDFNSQFTAFKSTALCVARTLLSIWCVAQCAAAIPFIAGISARGRCFFVPHLVLDALFLVILFIYGITITVFAVVIFALIQEMPLLTLVQWLLFAAVLDIVFALYTLMFSIKLRCCESHLLSSAQSESRGRSKSLLYTEIGSQQTLHSTERAESDA